MKRFRTDSVQCSVLRVGFVLEHGSISYPKFSRAFKGFRNGGHVIKFCWYTRKETKKELEIPIYMRNSN